MITPNELRRALLPLKDQIVAKFKLEHWLELGTLTNSIDLVENHSRLLRSLDFGDQDYSGHALSQLLAIVERDPDNFKEIERYVREKFDQGGISISSIESTARKIYFTPTVFQLPAAPPDQNLLSVMMPFSGQFTPVYAGIKEVAEHHAMGCQRADDIWEHSHIIQDVFSLIYRSYIVVCDFSDRNPNVFYEAGIAHTLGKHVIPLTQRKEDIPFDLQSHRYIPYLNNAEGIRAMQDQLSRRVSTLLKARPQPPFPWEKGR